MSNAEHYFENLLFHGEDIKGEPNKRALSKEVQDAIETCAAYVTYTMFSGQEDLKSFLENSISGSMTKWAREFEHCENCNLAQQCGQSQNNFVCSNWEFNYHYDEC